MAVGSTLERGVGAENIVNLSSVARQYMLVAQSQLNTIEVEWSSVEVLVASTCDSGYLKSKD